MMLNIVAFVIIVGVISIWRWSMPIVFGSVLVWASYDGNWLAFPYVIVCAGEIVSAWTGEAWTRVVWKSLRSKK